jgi:hypothetical protein
MCREKLTTLENAALVEWSTGATNEGGESPIHSQSRDSFGQWEANYLLPQLLTGAEHQTYATKRVLPGLLRRLLRVLGEPQLAVHLLRRRPSAPL